MTLGKSLSLSRLQKRRHIVGLLSYLLSGDRCLRKPDWREETFPSAVLLIPLPTLRPVTQGSSESPVLRTKTQGASSGMYTVFVDLGRIFQMDRPDAKHDALRQDVFAAK